MPLLITKELLTDLGFVQQNPPTIWDYQWHGNSHYFRFVKDGKDWYFSIAGKNSCIVPDFMAVVRVIAVAAYAKGVEDTQDQVHNALGFERLLDKMSERFQPRDHD